MTTRHRYTRDELMSDPPYAERIERNGVRFHGGYDTDGTYLPPRSLHRAAAIDAWTRQLEAAGHPTSVVDTDAVKRSFVPNATQAKMLPRGEPGDLLHDPDEIAARVVGMARDGAVPSVEGTAVPISADSVCVHGDTPGAVAIARAVRAALEQAGVAVRAFGD